MPDARSTLNIMRLAYGVGSERQDQTWRWYRRSAEIVAVVVQSLKDASDSSIETLSGMIVSHRLRLSEVHQPE